MKLFLILSSPVYASVSTQVYAVFPIPAQTKIPIYDIDPKTKLLPAALFNMWESVFPEPKNTRAQEIAEAELFALLAIDEKKAERKPKKPKKFIDDQSDKTSTLSSLSSASNTSSQVSSLSVSPPTIDKETRDDETVHEDISGFETVQRKQPAEAKKPKGNKKTSELKKQVQTDAIEKSPKGLPRAKPVEPQVAAISNMDIPTMSDVLRSLETVQEKAHFDAVDSVEDEKPGWVLQTVREDKPRLVVDVAVDNVHENKPRLVVDVSDASIEDTPLRFETSKSTGLSANAAAFTPRVSEKAPFLSAKKDTENDILLAFINGPRPIVVQPGWTDEWVSSSRQLYQIRRERHQVLDADYGKRFKLLHEPKFPLIQSTAIGDLQIMRDISSSLVPRTQQFPRHVFVAVSLRTREPFEIKYADLNSDVYVKNEIEILTVLSEIPGVQRGYYLSGAGSGWVMESRISVLEHLQGSIVHVRSSWQPWQIISAVTDAIETLRRIHQAGFVHGRVSEYMMRLNMSGHIVLTEFEFSWFYPDRSQAPITDGINIFSSPFEMELTPSRQRLPVWMDQGKMLALPPTRRDDIFRALEAIPRLLTRKKYYQQVTDAFAAGKLFEFKMETDFLNFDVFQDKLNPVLDHIRDVETEIDYYFVIQSLRQVQQILAR